MFLNYENFGFGWIKRYNLPMGITADKSRGYLLVRVLVGLLGLSLSFILHELFHIVMHWGRITHISFFPSPWTVVQIDAWIPPGYDLDGEEIAAYGITLLVMFITVIFIFRIKDSEDKRSSVQILFPENREMQKLNPSEMLELSELGEAETGVSAATRPHKPRRPTTK